MILENAEYLEKKVKDLKKVIHILDILTRDKIINIGVHDTSNHYEFEWVDLPGEFRLEVIELIKKIKNKYLEEIKNELSHTMLYL